MAHRPHDFQDFVSWIFEALNIPKDAAATSSGIYAVNLEASLQIQLIDRKGDGLFLLSVVGKIPHDAASLKALLQVNQFTFDCPRICLGVEPDVDCISMSAHCSLEGTGKGKAIELFDRFANASRIVSHWLTNAAERQCGPNLKSFASSLLQLRSGRGRSSMDER